MSRIARAGLQLRSAVSEVAKKTRRFAPVTATASVTHTAPRYSEFGERIGGIAFAPPHC